MSEKKRSWAELREEVRNIRRWLWSLAYRLPHSFAIREKQGGSMRLYFMSSPPNSKDNSLYAIDFPKYAPPLPPDQPPSVIYPWTQILPSGFQGSGGGIPSKEEELQMERKRMTPSGISAYEFHPPTARFLFNASTALYTCSDIDSNENEPLAPIEIQPSPSPSSSFQSHGARLNPEMCPYDPDLVAYVTNGDLFVVHSPSGANYQLTLTGEGRETHSNIVTAGYPSYIIQEEFNRFQGFWWNPRRNGNTYRIMYEEVDESDVGVVNLLSPPGSESEEYRFPTPGTPNAKSSLRIVQFNYKDRKISHIETWDFHHSLENYFPWAEYIVRAGWTPDGQFAWAQLLDRDQGRLELILITPPKHDFDGDGELSPPPYVIYSEVSPVWINVNDILEFFPYQHGDSIEFVWASEESGYRHLYRVKAGLPLPLSSDWATTVNPPIRLSPVIEEKVQLTSGKWEVMNTPTKIDFDRGLVFFLGLMNGPLERHLYVVSLQQGGLPHRLTSLGYSYTAYVESNYGLVILTYSNITMPPRCQLTRLVFDQQDPSLHSETRLEPITYLHTTPAPDSEVPVPLILTHQLISGETLYAIIYRPVNFDPEKKYPTILNIYGGPEVQLVYNSFKVSVSGSGQLWLYLLASQGYCVVSIDSRGSNHRGVEFESHIRRRMGTVELEDQVEVLNALIKRLGFIDKKRVGIYGWSYGGYLTLMGLANYPDVFKVAVAGAPVTSWELYDTGYTERYMGVPHMNHNAYQRSSVLSYIHQFPDEEDRLLIIHGLLDENVHFTHTAQLISALVKAGKPHLLQIYPNERHSLRRLEASEHYETTLLSFLHRNL